MKKYFRRINQKFSTFYSMSFTLCFLIFSLFAALTGCTNRITAETHSPEPTTTSTAAISPAPLTFPSKTHDHLSQSGGPYLLIQSDFSQYQIIDVATNKLKPFNPPFEDIQYNLSKNQSPSGDLMLFHVDNNTITVSSLVTGKIISTHLLHNEKQKFNVDTAARDIESFPQENSYSPESLKVMVEDAYQKSLSDIRWYKDDQYWLLSRDSSPNSTNLNLYDLNSRSFTSLENQPGLVLDFWIGPDKNQILLKKGYIDEPGGWDGHHYYVVDLNNHRVEPIPLPKVIDHPNVYWLKSETIGIIHKMAPIGGIDFSVFDLNSGKTTQIIKGSFSHVSLSSENLFWIKSNNTDQLSTIGVSNTKGEILRQQTISQTCLYKTQLENLIVLNCENISLIITEAFEVMPFGDAISFISHQSKSNTAILVTQNGAVHLLDKTTLEREPLTLEGTPVEIRWLPDGSGFLYRTAGKLYFLDLDSRLSTLLLDSQYLGDYSNINAVWIRLTP